MAEAAPAASAATAAGGGRPLPTSDGGAPVSANAHAAAGGPGLRGAAAEEDDVLLINVGGERFTTTRATLCQAEGSALAALFSPRWFGAAGGQQAPLPRDREGLPFLDYDPTCFRLLLGYLRQRRLAGPDAAVAPPAMPASMQGAWALFVDYLGLGEYLQEGREGGSGSGNGDVEGATRQGEGKGEGRCASEEEEAEDGASLGMAVEGLRLPGPAAAWAGGGGPCSVAPLVFDVVSKGVTTVPDGSAAFMVYSHDHYGFAACSTPLLASATGPRAWRCRVTLSLTAPRAALSLSLGLLAGGLGQAAAAAFPAVGLSSNGAEGGGVHGQRSFFIPRAHDPHSGPHHHHHPANAAWRDGFRDGDEVVMRLNPSDRTLDVAVLRARGAVRCCGYRLALPPVVGGGLLGAGAGGGAGSKEGVAARDRWFFCCYLSNGVGIDLLPVTPEEVDYALASL